MPDLGRSDRDDAGFPYEGFKACPTCGLNYQATLSHGAVDCFAHFRSTIERLRREVLEARGRAIEAEAMVAAVRAALRDE